MEAVELTNNGKSSNLSWLKVLGGIIISLFFFYLAFRKVDILKLIESFNKVNYLMIFLAIIPVIGSCWLRAFRHRCLLEVIKPIKTGSLFSALMIGYTANTALPAHLGEFLRAFVIGKKEAIPVSSTFATIVVERVLDVFSLLFIMAILLLMYPLPREVRLSGYLTFLFAAMILLFFWILKKWPEKLLAGAKFLINPFSGRFAEKFAAQILAFRDGLVPLKSPRHYFYVLLMTCLIWLCYASIYHLGFYAFNFLEKYHLPLSAGLVLSVITTISVIIPSSPGYVGTYHWLCMIALGLFAVPDSEGLGYAFVIHAVNTVPIVLVGLIYALKEKIDFKTSY